MKIAAKARLTLRTGNGLVGGNENSAAVVGTGEREVGHFIAHHEEQRIA